MLVSAFFGMMAKFSEVVSSVYFREKEDKGVYHGGPMYHLEKGLKQKWLAILFAIFASKATFGAGNIIGGIKRISSVSEKFVPFMASIYFVASIIILIIDIKNIPQALKLIISEAFSLNSAQAVLWVSLYL